MTGRIAISGVTGAGAPCTILKLRERGVLPELAAERIAHTRLGCRQTTLDGHGRLFVEVRRRPRTGELMWVLVSDGGFGCGGTGGAGPCGCSPGVREQIDVLVADFQDELGVIGPVGPVIRPPQR